MYDVQNYYLKKDTAKRNFKKMWCLPKAKMKVLLLEKRGLSIFCSSNSSNIPREDLIMIFLSAKKEKKIVNHSKILRFQLIRCARLLINKKHSQT